MYYYKLFNDEKVLGVVSSHDLRVYSLANHSFMNATEENAQYVQLKDNFYRVDWLKPESVKANVQEAQMHIISKREYDLEKLREKVQKEMSI